MCHGLPRLARSLPGPCRSDRVLDSLELRPYVTPERYWLVDKHGSFQGYSGSWLSSARPPKLECMPPSTEWALPVMKDESSLARNSTSCATSWG